MKHVDPSHMLSLVRVCMKHSDVKISPQLNHSCWYVMFIVVLNS